MFGDWISSSRSHWSLSRRLLWITLAVVLGQSLISLAINHSLRQHLIDDVLRGTMHRQGLLILDEIREELNQLTPAQKKVCCSLSDYQRFLRNLNLSDGKVALIVGDNGMATSRSSRTLFDENQLRQFAERAMQSEDGFTVLDISSREAVAVQEVKLPGGPETGNFVYIRPVYGMPLLKSQRMMKLGSELILIFITGVILILSARRPLRAIKQDLSTVELSNLKGATIPTDKAPLELLPIIEEFNEMVGRLRHSSTNQKQFAATISHEFRTPLTVISGFIQSVLNRGEEQLPDHHKQALGIADTEVLRLNRMLSDLLDLSRADNQQLSIRRESFELIPSLEQVLKLAKAAYDNPITNNLKELPYMEVVGDPDRLVQCIGNLIGNAVKYSEKGSPIDLRVSSDDSKVTVCVSDHGQGIPADQLDNIFERFTRAEGVVLPKGESSTGLGLSIVKMLMEAMGGTINVRSIVGEGSFFSLQLPLSSDRP